MKEAALGIPPDPDENGHTEVRTVEWLAAYAIGTAASGWAGAPDAVEVLILAAGRDRGSIRRACGRVRDLRSLDADVRDEALRRLVAASRAVTEPPVSRPPRDVPPAGWVTSAPSGN